jgi:NAD(P)-dependent dehydrogenase (short-subunit alcohol dehydrogenase family)
LAGLDEHGVVLIVFGYGPGISHATAERFARDGYSLALVARNADRLADGVARLKANGIEATAYLSDATDPTMIRSTIATIRQELGTVSAVLWTAFRSGAVTNVLATRPEDVDQVFDIGVKGLLACVQEVLEDLKSSPGAAVLLAERLRDFDIYVGEVTIAGSVKGTATATPNAIEPAEIADTFWSLVHDRDKTRARIAEPGFA